MMTIDVPELSLVVLVGVSGAGKSRFAAARFLPTEVVSSDVCRGLVADDEEDQAATPEAFEVLHTLVGARLRRGKLTVVDATNVEPEARAGLLRLAKENDCPAVAIVLDVELVLARARAAQRPGRVVRAEVVERQFEVLRRTLGGLEGQGFAEVHVLRGPEEIEAARITRRALPCMRREDRGPFDIIGDVHGCYDELCSLLEALGYRVEGDRGRPRITAPAGRRVIFLGDLVDRGPDAPGALRLAMSMVAEGTALALPGNHEAKLLRKLAGKNVRLSHGLGLTVEQLAREPASFPVEVARFIEGLTDHYVLDEGRLVVAHAGLREGLQGRSSGRVRSFCLYGDTTGETDERGLPVRLDWAQGYRGRAAVIYGHTPTREPEWVNETLCVDTGCVFGGRLSALRYPERELVSVPAARVYYEPTRAL